MEIAPVFTPSASASPIFVISIVPVDPPDPSVALTESPVKIASAPIAPSKMIAAEPDSNVRDWVPSIE